MISTHILFYVFLILCSFKNPGLSFSFFVQLFSLFVQRLTIIPHKCKALFWNHLAILCCFQAIYHYLHLSSHYLGSAYRYSIFCSGVLRDISMIAVPYSNTISATAGALWIAGSTPPINGSEESVLIAYPSVQSCIEKKKNRIFRCESIYACCTDTDAAAIYLPQPPSSSASIWREVPPAGGGRR